MYKLKLAEKLKDLNGNIYSEEVELRYAGTGEAIINETGDVEICKSPVTDFMVVVLQPYR